MFFLEIIILLILISSVIFGIIFVKKLNKQINDNVGDIMIKVSAVLQTAQSIDQKLGPISDLTKGQASKIVGLESVVSNLQNSLCNGKVGFDALGSHFDINLPKC